MNIKEKRKRVKAKDGQKSMYPTLPLLTSDAGMLWWFLSFLVPLSPNSSLERNGLVQFAGSGIQIPDEHKQKKR